MRRGNQLTKLKTLALVRSVAGRRSCPTAAETFGRGMRFRPIATIEPFMPLLRTLTHTTLLQAQLRVNKPRDGQTPNSINLIGARGVLFKKCIFMRFLYRRPYLRIDNLCSLRSYGHREKNPGRRSKQCSMSYSRVSLWRLLGSRCPVGSMELR
jgi:hypothetical protein